MVCGLSIIYLLLPAVKQREVARSAVGLPLQSSEGQLGASTHKPHITLKRTDKLYRLSIGNTSLPHAHMAGLSCPMARGKKKSFGHLTLQVIVSLLSSGSLNLFAC